MSKRTCTHTPSLHSRPLGGDLSFQVVIQIQDWRCVKEVERGSSVEGNRGGDKSEDARKTECEGSE